MKIVVIEYKLCSLEYFLDKMQSYELIALMPYIQYSSKEDWEQTRLKSYIIAQCHSTKKINPEDIISFDWDKKTNKNIVVTEEDKKRLIEKMNKIIEIKQNNNG